MRILFIIFFVCKAYVLAVIIDERKIDVYFANGIDTEEFEAINNAALLDSAIKEEMPDVYEKYLDDAEQGGKVGYSYNQTVNKGVDIFSFHIS